MEYKSSYFDTVEASTQLKFDFEARNQEQDKNIVLAFFKANKDKSFTPIEVDEAINGNERVMLLTSVRRSITMLTGQGKLIKLAKTNQKMEKHGSPNYRWQYNKDYKNGIGNK